MTVACSKNLSITVTGGSLADAYWTFSESGIATDRVDMVHAIHLFPTASNQNDAEPGLFANGLGYLEKGAASQFNANSQVPEIALQNPAQGWSLWFWFKVLHWADDLPFNTGWSIPPSIEFTNRFGAGNNFDMHLGWDPLGTQWGFGGPPNTMCFELVDVTGTTFAPVNFVPTIGAWTFIHVFFDGATGTFGYSINDGANVLSAAGASCAGAISPATLSIFQVWAELPTATISLIIDEMGLKVSRKLTAAEQTFLYNGGVGRTWPL